ncbi:uncharacterized protein BP5553_03743 [Venustampulla echinocandica]|uniref:Uncharacterized protein n=1 Tax=Venustampulla echinocandica TaxID=2656787 RepID=A0A370TV36_9HELO|nr:uncharacterized protein BP5553_03743 [Venustampulla echinocandica]RDL39403.1 hypothetical protein BP5553_03743 [Venustampulla echinocandica]
MLPISSPAALLLLSPLLSVAALVTRQVPMTADIFHLAACSNHSSILYFADNTSPHPATPPTDTYTLPPTEWNETYTRGLILEDSLIITINADAYTKPVDEKIGRAMYADIESCKDTGYSILNCFRGAEEVVWDGDGDECVGEFYCTRAMQAVC